MLTTPPGRSLVKKTGKRPPVIGGYDPEGTATTVFPAAISGNTIVKNPSSGYSEGQTTPTVPTASFIAIETFRIGGLCTDPSNLSAHPAYENNRSTLRCTSSAACFFPPPDASLPAISSLRCDKFSAM